MDTEIEPNALDDEFKYYWDRVNCYVAHEVPYEERCAFVNRAVECNRSTNVVPYMRLMSCVLKCRNTFQELIVLAVFVVFSFLMLLLLLHVVYNYYGPALKTVSKLIKMNEHLAGVTLLAFGNSSADLFASLANIRSNLPVYSASMSSALFVSLVSGGLVCYVNPFMMNGFETVRDILFLIFGVSLVYHSLLRDNELSEVEFSFLLLVYIFYIMVNVVDLYLMRREVTILENKITELLKKEQTREVIDEIDDLEQTKSRFEDNKVEIFEKRTSRITMSTLQYTTKRMALQKRTTVNEKRNRDLMYDRALGKNRFLFKEFLLALRPIQCRKWRRANMIKRALLVAKVPAVIVCALYIPLVDYEMKKHGWNKLLNILHVILNPAISTMICFSLLVRPGESLWYMEIKEDYIYGAYSLVITLPLAVFIFFNARTDMPPSYHWGFTLMNLSGCMFMIYVCATEIDKVMEVISRILELDEEFMGASVKCWTSNLGPLIANTAVAMHGYPKMAYASAIGGPIFTVVLSPTIVLFTRKLLGAKDDHTHAIGEYGFNAFYFLLFGLVCTLLWTTSLGFYARRSMGVFSISVYVLYMIFVKLIHSNIIHSFSYDRPVHAAIGDI